MVSTIVALTLQTQRPVVRCVLELRLPSVEQGEPGERMVRGEVVGEEESAQCPCVSLYLGWYRPAFCVISVCKLNWRIWRIWRVWRVWRVWSV